MEHPLVSVLMTVYNGERYLQLAVESILTQSFTHFELIIVDDGSTDGTPAILRAYAAKDARVRLRLLDHQGLVPALNTGLDMARGAYVARMDADDIAYPHRLARQLETLERQPEIGLLGTAIEEIDEHGRHLRTQVFPADDLVIRWGLLFGNLFSHPSVMIRRDLLDRFALRYNAEYDTAEDYELWVRLLDVTRSANLTEPCIAYRRHEGVSARRSAEQSLQTSRISTEAIKGLAPGLSISLDQATMIRELLRELPEALGNPNVPRPALMALYLDVLASFSARYHHVQGLSQLRTRELRRALKLAMRAPYQRGRLRFIARLTTLDPAILARPGNRRHLLELLAPAVKAGI